MATKITLLAQDIKVGTEIVQFALASGAAIMEYGESDSPLAKPKAKKKRKLAPPRRDQNAMLVLVPEVAPRFQVGSMRGKAIEKLLLGNASEATRRGWVQELRNFGYSDTQSTTLIAGFLKQGAIVEAEAS